MATLREQYHVRSGTIYRFDTYCCALGQLSLSNLHSEEDIKVVIETIKKENETPVNQAIANKGERAMFVITLPTETLLEEKLVNLGFKMIYEFHRRNCYPADELLKMWILSW